MPGNRHPYRELVDNVDTVKTRAGPEVVPDAATAEAPTRPTSIEERRTLTRIEAAGKAALRAAHPLYEGKTAAVLRTVLRDSGYEIRWNSRGARVEVRSLTDRWRPLRDTEEARLREHIAETYDYHTERGPRPLKYGREAWEQAVLAVVEEVDPFEEWLRSLPEWDGRPRIDDILAEHFLAADTAVNRWASSFLLMGAVARTLHPGLKLDQMVVLSGAQGLGKSALLSSLFPPDHPEWFSDGLNLADRTRERAEALLGRVIVEASEMTGSTRAEVESLKAFITRQDDGNVRLAYARRPETMLRRSIIIGTTNSRESLPNDPTGLRRFVPVDLNGGCHIEEVAGRLRSQWWSEAWERVAEGEHAAMPRELLTDAAEVAEAHRSRDSIIEDAIAVFTMAVRAERHVGPFTMADIGKHTRLSDRPGFDRNTKRIGGVLRGMGWTTFRQRSGSGQVTYWTLDE